MKLLRALPLFIFASIVLMGCPKQQPKPQAAHQALKEILSEVDSANKSVANGLVPKVSHPSGNNSVK